MSLESGGAAPSPTPSPSPSLPLSESSSLRGIPPMMQMQRQNKKEENRQEDDDDDVDDSDVFDDDDCDSTSRPTVAYLQYQITPNTQQQQQHIDQTKPTTNLHTPSTNEHADSIRVDVCTTDKPNIISINLWMRVPFEQIKSAIIMQPQLIPDTNNQTPTSTSNSTQSTRSVSTDSHMVSTVSIVDVADSSSVASAAPSHHDSSATSTTDTTAHDSHGISAHSDGSVLVHFVLPSYNFTQHNYLGASSHLLQTYPSYFTHLTMTQDSIETNSAEESLSRIIQQAVDDSYQLWSSCEKTSSNTALLSLLSSLQISSECASAMLEEEIEVKDLLFLSDEDLRTFIPRVGPRRRLTKWIEKVRELNRRRDDDQRRSGESDRTEAESEAEVNDRLSPNGRLSGRLARPVDSPSVVSGSVTPIAFSPNSLDADDRLDTDDEEPKLPSYHTNTTRTQLHMRQLSSSGIDDSEHTDQQTEWSETEHEVDGEVDRDPSMLIRIRAVEESVLECADDDLDDDSNRATRSHHTQTQTRIGDIDASPPHTQHQQSECDNQTEHEHRQTETPHAAQSQQCDDDTEADATSPKLASSAPLHPSASAPPSAPPSIPLPSSSSSLLSTHRSLDRARSPSGSPSPSSALLDSPDLDDSLDAELESDRRLSHEDGYEGHEEEDSQEEEEDDDEEQSQARSDCVVGVPTSCDVNSSIVRRVTPKVLVKARRRSLTGAPTTTTAATGTLPVTITTFTR